MDAGAGEGGHSAYFRRQRYLGVDLAVGDPHWNYGRLNALAVGSTKRHPVAPTVATLEELGQKGVEVDMWYAFLAPAKTPAPVVTRLNTEIAAILKLPEIQNQLGRAGLDAVSSSPEDLGNTMRKDYPRWGAVIKANGIKAE